MKKKPPLPIEFTELPERDAAHVYTITNEPSALPEYGRLLTLVNYFRQHAEYGVLGDPGVGITINGPTPIAEIEARFLLPSDLSFERRHTCNVTLTDGDLRIEFQATSFWAGGNSPAAYDGRDALTGNHTRHWT